MRSNLYVWVLIIGAMLISTSRGTSQTTSIKGVFFSDYYYNVQNHSAAAQDRNAFEFRRIYFTLENSITETIKIRFRLEANHDKYGTTSKITPFVKHAYLEWNDFIPSHKLYLGIAETNAFKNAETYWGYRSIEKTAMDLNKISSSADMGIALKGDLGVLAHHWLTLFNGTGYGSPEGDRYKKVGYAFWLTPVKGLILEGYADYENQDPDEAQTENVLSSAKDLTGSTSYYTMKTFVGYENIHFTVGAEAFWKTNKNSAVKGANIAEDNVSSATKADVTKFGYSLFGSWITPIPKLKLFGRYDYFDPNNSDDVYTSFSNGSPVGGVDDEYSLIIAGLDYIPKGNIHFMPNVLVKSYAKSGVDSDITARVTLYLKFDSGKIIIE